MYEEKENKHLNPLMWDQTHVEEYYGREYVRLDYDLWI
jgi:hypothetical protein